MKTSLGHRTRCAAGMLAMLFAVSDVIAQERHQRFELAFTPFLPVRTIQI